MRAIMQVSGAIVVEELALDNEHVIAVVFFVSVDAALEKWLTEITQRFIHFENLECAQVCPSKAAKSGVSCERWMERCWIELICLVAWDWFRDRAPCPTEEGTN